MEQISRQTGVGQVARPGCWRPGRAEAALSCAALLFAFLPVLVDLARHLSESAWARYAVLFAVLAVHSIWRDPAPVRAARRDAPLWILAGLLVLLAGHFMGAVRWGRIGAVLAAIGICRRYGWGSWRSQALLLFAVPLPAIALRLAAPLSQQMLSLAQSAVGWLGGDVAALALGRAGSALALLPLLAGLGWYAALRRQLSLRAALACAFGAALLAVPVQWLAIALAAVAAQWFGAGAARGALIHGTWLLVAALGVFLAERGARARVPQ